jgi:hypothetical protein
MNKDSWGEFSCSNRVWMSGNVETAIEKCNENKLIDLLIHIMMPEMRGSWEGLYQIYLGNISSSLPPPKKLQHIHPWNNF